MLVKKRTPLFCRFFGAWFQPPKQFISLYSSNCFASYWYTQLIQVRNEYMIIYTTKKHHFTWTSMLNYLIGLFFKV